MSRDKELHKVAQKYLDNYLKIRSGEIEHVYQEDEQVRQIPWRHDLDELATVYMHNYNETQKKDFVNNVHVGIASLHVALVRENTPRYFEGILRSGRIFWTKHFHKAKKIPYETYRLHQEKVRRFEPDTFAVWA
jgi:hypothetical protein